MNQDSRMRSEKKRSARQTRADFNLSALRPREYYYTLYRIIAMAVFSGFLSSPPQQAHSKKIRCGGKEGSNQFVRIL